MSLQVFLNPWGDNVVSRCQSPAYLPAPTDDYLDSNRAEITLNELIIPFLAQHKTLRLSDCLWKYWIAKYSPLGINLPILSSAVETLAERVLKAHPEVKHYYVESKEFQALIAEELASIQHKLGAQEHL
jgi:hypothetical protein